MTGKIQPQRTRRITQGRAEIDDSSLCIRSVLCRDIHTIHRDFSSESLLDHT